MDDERFDALSRMLGNGTSRRGALGLLAGVAGLGLGEVVAKRRKHGKGKGKGKGRTQATAEKKDHKITICHLTNEATNPVVQIKVDESAVPAHQAHGDTIDPDFQNDVQNCGSCGTGCTGGDACNTPACQNGKCGTTPTPGVACDGGTGTCDANGRCQPNTPNVCSGSPTTICFVRDGAICGNHNPPCHCLTGLDGTPFCSENVYCNTPSTECETNADCVAMGFEPGTVCMSADPDGACCVSKTGCATPCPSLTTS